MFPRVLSHSRPRICVLACLACPLPPTTANAADTVIQYDQGANPALGYVDPSTALGPPEQFTGDGIDPGVVSPFNPAWLPTEIVSIGRGGELILGFDPPVTNDDGNPYGIDLIVFGNSFVLDAGNARCGTPCATFSEGGIIEVSPDGENWVVVPDRFADDFPPTLAYRDAAAYQATPGSIPTDPSQPVDPRLAPTHFDGLGVTDIDALYYGSAGGVGIDLATVNLDSIVAIRIHTPADSQSTPEIDAVMDVVPVPVGDANFSGEVNIDDLLLVINDFGTSPIGGPATDVNRNTIVNIDDLVTVLNAWTAP